MKKKLLLLTAVLVIALGLHSCTLQQKEIPSIEEESSQIEASETELSDSEVSEIEASSPWIDLEGVQNARLLCGDQTPIGSGENRNIILRTGQLSGLTDADRELLITEYKLAHIIDLRDELETEYYPDPVIEGVEYHYLNVWLRDVRARIIEESTLDGEFDSELYVKNYYTVFALDSAAVDAYRKMFDILLENDGGGILIHCAYGKDRTGVAAALILSALGVEWDVIEEEYLLSNISMPGSINISSLRHYRSTIEDTYGSMENYLKEEMELDETSLLTLREKYTPELSVN